jgi:hypothetical protein
LWRFLSRVFVAFLPKNLESEDILGRDLRPRQGSALREDEIELQDAFKRPAGVRPCPVIVERVQGATGAADNRR